MIDEPPIYGGPPTPKYPKRIRIRKCTRKLYLPSEDGRHYTTMSCMEPVHELGTPHKATLMVFMPSGSGQRVDVTWVDLGIMQMRRLTKEQVKVSNNAAQTKRST